MLNDVRPRTLSVHASTPNIRGDGTFLKLNNKNKGKLPGFSDVTK